jgi:hypothetical protein
MNFQMFSSIICYLIDRLISNDTEVLQGAFHDSGIWHIFYSQSIFFFWYVLISSSQGSLYPAKSFLALCAMCF